LDNVDSLGEDPRVSIEAVIAATRFGLGARPGELSSIGTDPKGSLAAQVKGARPIPEAIQRLPASADIFRAIAQVREERGDSRPQPTSEAEIAQLVGAVIRQKLLPMYQQQVAARYRLAGKTQEPFRERLVHFWTNHFAVSVDKVQLLGLAGALENEAIRPNVAGRFADMLVAVESHPAMILYLDNQTSIGPRSTLATRAAARLQSNGRKLGINENLAREILELHTLGVNGGYSQADVTTFAQALTGWSIGGARGLIRDGEPGKFVFRDVLHEPGAKTILGKRYAEGGVAQPRAILDDLARHPATATHVATKLVRHFVADDPPEAAVKRVAKAFRDSDGDLPTVHRALIELPQAWAQPFEKFKTPHEFVVATFRAFDFVPQQPQQVIAPFRLLGQRPYSPGSPAGWPDTASQWDGPDALLKRIEWASAIGERLGDRFRPLELAAAALGDSLTERTRTAVARAASAAQGVALLLASPEFQRR
jgi:uncharacterized protein (DUF1800 family)